MCGNEDDDLMPTLMFSYYHLEPALKSCFSFCSVFPQDYVIDKEILIRLWSGYLASSGINYEMKDVAETYFSILLHRCFFQDVNRKIYDGRVVSVKMHDLMHDLAQTFIPDIDILLAMVIWHQVMSSTGEGVEILINKLK